MRTRRQFLHVVCAGVLTHPLLLLAEKPARAWRVGFLATRKRPDSLENDTYGQVPLTLRELGYYEGKNLNMEWRFADGDFSRLPALAAELVKLPVDVIVTDGSPGIRAALGATKTIPIVFNGGTDLVAAGLIQSLSRPGGNATGVTLLLQDTIAKQLEILVSLSPRTTRIGLLMNSANKSHSQFQSGATVAAQTAKLGLFAAEAGTAQEIEAAFEKFAKERCDGLLWAVDTFFYQQRSQIAELALRRRLPSVTGYPEYSEAGGLAGYGPNRRDLYRRVAVYVDKILKGANPGELPVEQPTKLDFVINKKTASALGLTIPPELQVLADKVIE